MLDPILYAKFVYVRVHLHGMQTCTKTQSNESVQAYNVKFLINSEFPWIAIL